jgi:hypothetical protein
MPNISSLTLWLRIEPGCRSADFGETLRARVHDPLWLLGRSWQLGELTGSDGGSPVVAQVDMHSDEVTHCTLRGSNGAASEASLSIPLEPFVEAMPVDLEQDLLLLARLGLVFAESISDQPLLARLHAAQPLRADKFSDAPASAHAFLDALAGKVIDVAEFLRAPRAATAAVLQPLIGGAVLTTAQVTVLRLAIDETLKWLGKFAYSATGSAWVADAAEYRFAIAAEANGARSTLVADSYHDGEVDWFSFDAEQMAPAAPSSKPRWCVPGPVRYPGMPHERWWYMEDAWVDPSSVRADTTDVGRLAALGFITSTSNDWFVIPVPNRRSAVARVKQISAFDSFGREQRYESAESLYGGWSMFTASPASGDGAPSNLLFVPTTSPVHIDGRATEEVELVRDETLNVVFAIERTLPDYLGGSIGGAERADQRASSQLASYRRTAQILAARWDAGPKTDALLTEVKAAFDKYRRAGGERRDIDGGPPAADSDLGTNAQYTLARWAPEYWIPFVPVINESGSTRLLRHALPRLDPETGALVRVQANGRIVRPDHAQPAPFYLQSQAVPRTGVLVSECAQFIRGSDGRGHFWFGRRKTAARGEASSGIRFDVVERRFG